MFIYQKQEEYLRFILSEHATKEDGFLSVLGSGNTLGAYLITRLHNLTKRTIVVVTNTQDDAKKYADQLSFFNNTGNSRKIVNLISRGNTPLEQVYYHSKVSPKRVACLYNFLETSSNLTVVTDLLGIKQKVIPVEALIEYSDLIKVGREIKLASFIHKLASGGYNHTFLVEQPGDFSVRGEIIDFFSPIYPEPIRIELLGNLVESIKIFSSTSQRTIQSMNEVVLLPAREAIVERDKIALIIGKIRAIGIKYKLSHEYLREITTNIEKKYELPRVENIAPLMYDCMDSLFDYIPKSTIFVTIDRSKFLENDNFFEKSANTTFDEAIKFKKLCTKPEDLFLKYSFIKQKILYKNSIDYRTSKVSEHNKCVSKIKSTSNLQNNHNITLNVKNYRNSDKLSSSFIKILLENKANNYLTIIVCRSKNQVGKITLFLSSENIDFSICEEFPDTSKNISFNSDILICTGKVNSGFVFSDISLSLIIYDEMFDVHSNNKEPCSNNKSRLLNLESLKSGDYIVHTEHGIGQYKGLVKLNVNKTTSEFLLILYRDNDKLYLPVDRMELLHKYVGFEGGYIPTIDKIGGKTWRLLKGRARYSVEKIAGTLLKIYAERKVKKGYSFSCRNEDLVEFGSSFKHKETPDQLRAIHDVIGDMKKTTPMDRLICGDVGYGKTEIALRASFAAVMEAKQVVILVPTTILAEQHFNTFLNRFKRYPTRIACLSRFKSKNEQKHIIKCIQNGLIDIIIGTHRLLQNDVSFMNLGLLILDEEQRFGVNHKEKIKQMRITVDVLALTATPIPRTLHLSLMGIRDISVISSPPNYRKPILTQICEFDYKLITAAIRKELSRKGQIFFIHNNIRTIQVMAQHIKDYVPEVRLKVAHGQMSKNNLESVMMDFIKNEIDMIVCTTIIESGIDISKANTIIINRADKLGLAQIYQIRGRVGRSDKQAYAYLFVPNKKLLSAKASRRLEVIMEHNRLGSGFQIAMHDIKIRGGGAILGASQAGHISAIGYEFFLKLMEESLDKIKGKPKQDCINTEINVPISAFIPEYYISDTDHRLTVYRRLSKTKQFKDLYSLKEELIDRFGSMPKETINIFLKIILKILGSHAGVEKMDICDRWLTLVFDRKYQTNPLGINIMIANSKGHYKLKTDGVFIAKLKSRSQAEYLLQVKNILIEVRRHVSS